jgi:hypothetical protein
MASFNIAGCIHGVIALVLICAKKWKRLCRVASGKTKTTTAASALHLILSLQNPFAPHLPFLIPTCALLRARVCVILLLLALQNEYKNYIHTHA